MLLAGYTEGLPLKGVATVPWTAAFSAFGCAAVDISHRYQKSTGVIIPYGADDGLKLVMGQTMLNTGWDVLERYRSSGSSGNDSVYPAGEAGQNG